MTRPARAMAALLVTAIVTAALGYGSRAPYTPPGADDALLRLSWRLRGEKQQTCRDRTEAELAALPAHMRTPQICKARLLSYRLVLRIDGTRPDTMIFAPAGAKGDRPIFVLHEVPLTPGAHEVSVDFEPVEQDVATRPPLSYRGRVRTDRAGVALVTLAADQSRIVVHTATR